MIICINNNEITFKENKISLSNFLHYKKNIICISINNFISDTINFISNNNSIFFIDNTNPRSLNILRHSCAHLLAHAINNIYMHVKFAFGPIIQNGFYYDFHVNQKIINKSIISIEQEMKKLTLKSIHIIKIKILKTDLIKFFYNNKYKLYILYKIKSKYISCYKQDCFLDLCYGPHINNTKFLKFFKLLKISGAYWKNDHENNMLYRIYGIIWNSEKQLKQFLTHENKTIIIDHKKIGNNLNFFCFDKNSTGVIFWNKHGWIIYKQIIKYLKTILFKNDYFEVNTPIIMNINIFNKSGHINKFSNHIFKYSNNNNITVLKPMNCPGHITIFKNFYKKSYKNLPFKIMEFGSCFRNELSGSLYGLMRLKNFIQDDGHIFCSQQDIYTEIKTFIILLKKVYFNFGFKLFKVVLSKRPLIIKNNYNIWHDAEIILKKALIDSKIKYSLSNDGAFYGPKIEFALKDALNRIWQCGTIQLDFFTAKKLEAKYSDKNSLLKYPIILHRAILGSLERFFGILIENNSGVLPFWLSAIQIEIVYINDTYLDYTKKIYNIINKQFRINLFISNERLDYKIKKCILEKIPYIIIVGKKEYKKNVISIRLLNSKTYNNISVCKFIKLLKLGII